MSSTTTLFDEEQPIASSSRVTLDSPPVAISSALPARLDEQTEFGMEEVEDHASSQSYDIRGKRKEGSETGSAGRVDHDMSETEDEDDHEHYEIERQRRIRENQLLIDSLGLKPSSTPLKSSFSMSTPTQSSAKRKKREADREVFDRSGYVLSLPVPGERRQRIACVEMPSDRRLRKRIAEGEYADCEHWWEGEERRWRFGHGQGENEEGEEEDFGGVTKDFRWRKWRGLEKELRMEMKQRGEMNRRDKAGTQQAASGTAEPSRYSLIQGDACHQCRRKSEKPKMRCRNINPICRAVFCETCCKRYSYFEFDSESRSFICPLCKDCCNCANCIRKRDLHHLLGPGRVGAKSRDQLQSGMTVQAWLEKATQERRGIPFDRVRLVDQATDVMSPDLPPETPPVVARLIKTRKRKVKELKEPKAKKTKISKRTAGGEIRDAVGKENGLIVKIEVPSNTLRVEEIDSDGDIIEGYSDDEDARSDASSKLTSLSENSPGPSMVSPCHSQSKFDDLLATNDYLASIVPASTDKINGEVPGSRPSAPIIGSMPHSDIACDDIPVRPRLASLSSQESAMGTGKKRRKPPPKANIVRAPKYSTLDASSAQAELPVTSHIIPETPLTADDQQTWQDDTNPMQCQSFSYEGYSTLPPVENLSPQPMQMSLPMPPMEIMMHGFPPPYSHSPPSRQVLPNRHVGPVYTNDDIMTNQRHHVQTQVSPTNDYTASQIFPQAHSVDPSVTGATPGYAAKAGMDATAAPQRFDGFDYGNGIRAPGSFWRGPDSLGMVNPSPSGSFMENGLMLNRRYFPGHP